MILANTRLVMSIARNCLPRAGRGMQFEALYAEHLLREGRTDSDLLPFDESITIMATLDDIRAQLGVVYPKER